ncbi:MAG: hypothetical protein V1750_01505 [Acidobacteriota bacterium]
MRRAEPSFPDLLPVSHRLGALPAGPQALLDPIEMRLVAGAGDRHESPGDRGVPRRPVRFLVHAEVATQETAHLTRLLGAGCGVVIVLDGALAPESIPAPRFPQQVVVVAPWLPPLWGRWPIPDLTPWRERAGAAGVLIGLAPAPSPKQQVRSGVHEAHAAGAQFVVAAPLSTSPQERHRVWDDAGGEDGHEELEDLLFHTDATNLLGALEREASRACCELGLAEIMPGPATAATSATVCAAGGALLLWARRLDLLEGVASPGWQLRRAARALLASGREPGSLVEEDNLRVIPGFNPWVEAFARSLWAGAGEPFAEIKERWLAAP